MNRILETCAVWFLLALAFAAMTLMSPEGTRPLWLVCTMLASANFGAKAVRAEMRQSVNARAVDGQDDQDDTDSAMPKV